MIKAAIFDLDGTLADTLDDLGTAMNGMLRHFGWPERTRDELQCFINYGARTFVARSMPDGSYDDVNDEIVSNALAVYSEQYSHCFNELTHPYDGIIEVLDVLASSEIKLGILSNKQDEFVKLIAEKLFRGKFQVVRGQTAKYPTKPDPTSALVTAKELGVNPEECVFIGDSDLDMKTAVNAGMYPIGVSWGYRSPDVLADAGAAFVAKSSVDLADHIIGKAK